MSRHGQPGHDTAGADAGLRRALGAGELGAQHDTGSRRGAARARAGGSRRAGHGAATRPAGRPGRGLCALAGPNWGHCAPDPIFTQFLDSILFLSQFMDTVHEPGS